MTRTALLQLLERWATYYRAADYLALTSMYEEEAQFLGSRPERLHGRTEIFDYFRSLPPMPDPDVDFSDVSIRMLAPRVAILAAVATFSTSEQSVAMRLTQAWIEQRGSWLIAAHHVSPRRIDQSH